VLDSGQLLPNIIADRACETPDRRFLQEIDGPAWSYAELDAMSNRWAAAFEAVGIEYGEHVLTMSVPRTDWFCAWMGLSRIGAVDVGVNTAFRGGMLEYVLSRSTATTLIMQAEFAERFTAGLLTDAGIELVVVTGADPAADRLPDFGPVRVVAADQFLTADSFPANAIRPQVWNICAVILTSGTTGPSKLVQVPWGSMYVGGRWYVPFPEVGPDDVFYQPLPTYHAAGRFAYQLMALAGGVVAQRSRFSMSALWSDIRSYGCTLSNISPFVKMMADAPEQPDDADNPLRIAVANPPPHDREAFEKRFGVLLTHSYGTSEIGIPICTSAPAWVPGSCGKVVAGWPYFEVRIVDENDDELPRGTIGQIALRSREPWGLNAGYFGDAEATVAAWRNGWFRQGDAMRMDDDGNLFFHDRINDAIRVRGENISSFEAEAEFNKHPAVLESAAIGVRVPGSEDELKAFLVLNDGAQLDPQEFCDFLIERTAKFMVPRYVEVVDSLPKTEATLRIKKTELRARARTANAWRREDRGRVASER
jgi:crotonobetaine/carnitine-CoA ligase